MILEVGKGAVVEINIHGDTYRTPTMILINNFDSMSVEYSRVRINVNADLIYNVRFESTVAAVKFIKGFTRNKRLSEVLD